MVVCKQLKVLVNLAGLDNSQVLREFCGFSGFMIC